MTDEHAERWRPGAVDVLVLAGVCACVVWLRGVSAFWYPVGVVVLLRYGGAALPWCLACLLFWQTIEAVPAFEAIYTDIGADLPLPTVLLINLAEVVQWRPFALVGAALTVASIRVIWDERSVVQGTGVALVGGWVGFAIMALFLPLIVLVERQN